MFNPMPDISQREIIIFYVCAVVLSGCNYNIKALSDGKKRRINNGLCLQCFFFTLWALDISYLQLCFTSIDCYFSNIFWLYIYLYRPATENGLCLPSRDSSSSATVHRTRPRLDYALALQIVVKKGVILAGALSRRVIYGDAGLPRCPQLCDCSNEAIKWAALKQSRGSAVVTRSGAPGKSVLNLPIIREIKKKSTLLLVTRHIHQR